MAKALGGLGIPVTSARRAVRRPDGADRLDLRIGREALGPGPTTKVLSSVDGRRASDRWWPERFG